jgi:hypothetical protein
MVTKTEGLSPIQYYSQLDKHFSMHIVRGKRNEVKLAAYWAAVSSVNNTVALGSPVQAIQEAETLIL